MCSVQPAGVAASAAATAALHGAPCARNVPTVAARQRLWRKSLRRSRARTPKPRHLHPSSQCDRRRHRGRVGLYQSAVALLQRVGSAPVSWSILRDVAVGRTVGSIAARRPRLPAQRARGGGTPCAWGRGERAKKRAHQAAWLESAVVAVCRKRRLLRPWRTPARWTGLLAPTARRRWMRARRTSRSCARRLLVRRERRKPCTSGGACADAHRAPRARSVPCDP